MDPVKNLFQNGAGVVGNIEGKLPKLPAGIPNLSTLMGNVASKMPDLLSNLPIPKAILGKLPQMPQMPQIRPWRPGVTPPISVKEIVIGGGPRATRTTERKVIIG